MKHTKTPWSIGYNDGKIVDIVSSQGGVIAAFKVEELGHTQKLNAEFIVHAVNMHSELVTALEECYSTINQLGYLSGDKLYQHNLTRIKEVLDKAERK